MVHLHGSRSISPHPTQVQNVFSLSTAISLIFCASSIRPKEMDIRSGLMNLHLSATGKHLTSWKNVLMIKSGSSGSGRMTTKASGSSMSFGADIGKYLLRSLHGLAVGIHLLLRRAITI